MGSASLARGYNIRRAVPADAAALVRVHLASWRTTYRGIVSDEFLDNMASRFAERTRRWAARFASTEEEVTFLAERAGEGPVGFASGGRERQGDPEYAGELTAIYIVREHQRRGLGRALVAAVASDLLRRSRASMLVWVLARNPYRRFYESLGGRPVRTVDYEMDGRSFELVAYGFDDVRALARMASDFARASAKESRSPA